MVKLFISHASEDKEALVRPLAHELKRLGIQIWYDEFTLKPGDSLRRSIDNGLAQCKAGLVVLSPSFFTKEWPQRELDALYTAEVAGRTKIIPIWYEIDSDGVGSFSPFLADRVAIQASLGVPHVATEISKYFKVPARLTGSQIAEKIERHLVRDTYALESICTGCHHRFLVLNAYKEGYWKFFERVTEGLTDDEFEVLPDEIEKKIKEEENRLREKYEIPSDAYLTTDEPVRESFYSSYVHNIGHWSSGTLSRIDSHKLVADLDHGEFDEYFILINVPNFSISSEQRTILESALVELGCYFKEGSHDVIQDICDKLRSIESIS